jgi:hypothetical protein
MRDDFTENELKIFGCFINPRYPAATRTLSAVAKETGLDEQTIMNTFKEFDEVLFQPASSTRWSFNITLFMARFHDKYPSLFSKYNIKKTSIGVVMCPKGISAEKVESVLKSVIDDPQQPESLCELLRGVLEHSPQKDPTGGQDEILSFPM